MKQKLVVIGNGMAAGHMLEELFDRGNKDYDVTIFGKEPRVNYNRIMLSPVLSGEKNMKISSFMMKSGTKPIMSI